MPADPMSILTFVPARDFSVSCRFYEALGFEAGNDDPDVRYYRRGAAGFLLQNFYVKKWADNFMMAMHVADLDDWWRDVETIVASAEFPGIRAKEPRLEDWGMRVGYLWDPSGVLWHITASPDS
ncbi:MAG: glyoxalase [Acidimicrobiia bacterium]|nr:glyoxalase [Acidimicrobiia bacterium]